MGLDMSLEAAVSVRFDERACIQNKKTRKSHTIKNASWVLKNVAYWRKANAIHNWFVTNVQNGVDNCKMYSVSRSQLERLLDTCTDVLDDPSSAQFLLPTVKGFFFGNTEYGEIYYEHIKDTVKMLQEALNDEKNMFFFYHSSW